MRRPHGRVRFRPHIAGRCTRRRRGGERRRRGGPVVHVPSGSRRGSRARRANWPLGAESIGRRRGKPRRRWGPMGCRGQPARRAPAAARRRYVRHYGCAGAADLSLWDTRASCMECCAACPPRHGTTGPNATQGAWKMASCAGAGSRPSRTRGLGVGSAAPSSVPLVTHAVQFRTLRAQ